MTDGIQVRLSETILVLQNELQQAIEYLSLPETRRISETAPGSAFVIPSKIKVRIPVVLEPMLATVPKEFLDKFTIPIKPLARVSSPDAKLAIDTTALLKMNARTPSDREGTAAKVVGELEIEFLIAVK